MTIEETLFPKTAYYRDGNPDKPIGTKPYHVIRQELRRKNLRYFEQMEKFLAQQPLTSKRRGVDLPYIGEDYFRDRDGIRVMMITQDSDAKDAGSIVFLGPMLPERYTQGEYTAIKRRCN
ncbi:hypothetical protein MO973_06695 [Paenibacillus sp. TRM 82003]|nr:hypothetical protein [Paenibacillus sp. TRM 82003]